MFSPWFLYHVVSTWAMCTCIIKKILDYEKLVQTYCLSKKSWPNLYSILLYKTGLLGRTVNKWGQITVCPRSFYPYFIVLCYIIDWVKTFWTCSTIFLSRADLLSINHVIKNLWFWPTLLDRMESYCWLVAWFWVKQVHVNHGYF